MSSYANKLAHEPGRQHLRKQVWQLSGELLGHADGEISGEEAHKGHKVPEAGGRPALRAKLQDLARDRSRRFAEELEFVQCLANPTYVQWLAAQGFLQDVGFQRFLEYLTYWRRPQYVRYIVYPQCLSVLDLLRDPSVRGRLHRPDAEGILAGNMLHAWGAPDEVQLRNMRPAAPEGSEPKLEAPKSPGAAGSNITGFTGLGADFKHIKAWLMKYIRPSEPRSLSEAALEVAKKHLREPLGQFWLVPFACFFIFFCSLFWLLFC
ncbi:unnamed protein product [Effrenium voratum]|nr:unnamed protein product [Effrenium voratum]